MKTSKDDEEEEKPPPEDLCKENEEGEREEKPPQEDPCKKTWNGIAFRLKLFKQYYGGQRFLFVFKPKKDALEDMFNFLDEVNRKALAEANSFEFGEFDRFDLQQAETAVKGVKAKILNRLQGSVQICNTDQKIICSDRATFGDFVFLIKSLEHPEPAIKKEPSARKKKSQKESKPPIYFKMFASIPSVPCPPNHPN